MNIGKKSESVLAMAWQEQSIFSRQVLFVIKRIAEILYIQIH